MKKLVQLGAVVLMMSLLPACQGMSEVNAEPARTAKLHNTLWKLGSLNGKSLQIQTGQRQASLSLSAEESRARIATACNTGSAGFTVNGSSLKFSVAMSTKMMCPPMQMEQEAAYMKVINDTARYEIKGEMLELYDANSNLLATFRSEFLK